MTHEELQKLLNTDLMHPHPDPSWDYYVHWEVLNHSRNRITDLISYLSQIEDATEESDAEITVRLEELMGSFDAIKHQLAARG